MGGDAQPQILLQVITRLLRYDALPGPAIAAPRWRLASVSTGFDTWDSPDETGVDVEDGGRWGEGLRALGHPVAGSSYGGGFGHAHLIELLDNGMRAGAADPRSEIGAVTGC
jgi:gamma-glutamyltranspeptidase/glutathione hydrolase